MKLLLKLILVFTVIHSYSQSNIVITEINYNMPGNDSLEYIEIYNKGGTAQNLNGYYFSNGITYTFGNYILNPSSYVVLSRYATFTNNFYSISSIQWTEGELSNSGEKIVLKDPAGNIVDSVEYEDGQPWDNNADGEGPSLTLCDVNQDNSLGYHWSVSSELRGFFFGNIIFGSPGTTNSPCTAPGEIFPPKTRKAIAATPSVVKVKFNEPVSTSSSQNTSNYTGLGTIVSAFRFSPDSVALTLFTPLETGAVDTLYVSNIADTSGNVMTAPRMEVVAYNTTIADLVITEIFYNQPGNDTLEFIEVYNRGTNPAIVGGYEFKDGIDFRFPNMMTINPGTYTVIARYPAFFNAFFGTSVSLQFGGALNNGGEKLKIENTAGDVIDSLTFLSSWNGATDPGPSLVLCDVNQDNHLPANWGSSGTLQGMFEGFEIYASPGAANTDCIPAGIFSKKETTFNLFPNPSSQGFLQVEFPNMSDRIIKLVDLNGKEVYSGQTNEKSVRVEFDRSTSGLYYIQVFDLKTSQYQSRTVMLTGL